jgi:virginiamycin B lyase
MKPTSLGVCFQVLLALYAYTATAQDNETETLPEGEGKHLVEFICTECHGLNQITRSPGYKTAAEWRAVFETMVKMADAQANTIAAYLAKNYPEKPGRRPTLVPGEHVVEIEEWIMPTLGQRSRDPIEGPDGDIWWTGMYASLIGRIDKDSGAMQEYLLPPAARPHSIEPGPDGNIWYTGNSNGTIGRLNPKTGTITEYKTRARDPHTGIFHPNGKYYFTSQQAGMLGRLDIKTGELTEIETRDRPYGIQVGPDRKLYVAYNGTNAIGAMDPDTLEIRYYDIPNDKSRIRRLGIDSKGIVWYGNSTMGKIGRLDPKTGAIKEWDSPSGPTSHPYALVVVNDVVWYNESGMRPDALVRFDPATEEFQSWPMPSGVGINRRMYVTKDNNILIHQSSTNRVGIVKIE